MLFNSFDFAVFFILCLTIYYQLKHRGQNTLLLIASYIFYGYWDWRFLGLILLSTTIDFFCALKISNHRTINKRKRFLLLSIVSNLSILGFFKYFNFFADSLYSLAGTFGWSVSPVMLNIILPVGISFYTFQSMSYTIDVYRKEVAATKSFGNFALYVAFFPQLIAGPIERGKRLLPQIETPRKVTSADISQASWLFFWGLYKKIFIADNLAKIVDPVFSSPESYTGFQIIIAVYAFAFQIYGDFSGYSDMARGIAKFFGFNLIVNFKLPYFVTNPRDFWRHWHISLSEWLRDYLFIPLGGSKTTQGLLLRNLIITMLLGGLWHGASWIFVLWGLYHGLLLLVHRLLAPLLKKISFKIPLPSFLKKIVLIGTMFHLTCIGWLIFRAESIQDLVTLLTNIAQLEIQRGLGLGAAATLLITICLLGIVQIYEYLKNKSIEDLLPALKLPIKGLVFTVIFYSLIWFGALGGKEFVYFQF